MREESNSMDIISFWSNPPKVTDVNDNEQIKR